MLRLLAMQMLRVLSCCLLVAGCSASVESGSPVRRRPAPGDPMDPPPYVDDGGDAGAPMPSSETCGNGMDDDGNGEIDDGCTCEGGSTQRCHSDPTVAGVGACAWGTQTCGGGEFGEWSECAGAGLPAAEACTDGVDNDCDGLLDCTDVDDCGCACAPPADPGSELVDVLSGYSMVEDCGPGCADLWVGRVGDNYWSGWCAIFEEETSISVRVPAAIRSAVLERALWDDYMQVLVNGTRVWSGPDGNFPPETGGECELSTSWDTNPGVDLTSQFMVGGEMRFRIRVSVSGGGEGYARIRILYDPVVVTGMPDCP